MKRVTISFSDQDARSVEYFLREKYGKDGRTKLAALCEIAIWQEVAAYAKESLEQQREQAGLCE